MEQQEELPTLHERRRNNDERPVNFSQIRRPRALRTDTGRRGSQPTTLQSPPETPLSTENPQFPNNDDSHFHNYLRAFCQFDPPTNPDDKDDALLTTAAIRPGDLILVHSVHANGWADGTVLTTGRRGWLPTNYCETFDHPYMKNLLNAMTQFWDLLGADEDANLSTFIRQDYIRGLIAGVRYLLEHADCLHRDAVLVKRSTGVRRMRKGLLADLSSLVQIAKRLQETIGETFAGDVVHVLLDDLMAKAFKVVTRAVGFVDMLAQESADAKVRPVGKRIVHDSVSTLVNDDGLSIDTGAVPRSDVPQPIDSAKHFPSNSTASWDSMAAATEGRLMRESEDRSQSRTSVFRPQSGLVTHRLSMIKKETSTKGGTFASEQLAQAHDLCISHIGAFIGLYLHSRPSSELVATTERLVSACKSMLAIVDQVSAHDLQKRTSIQQARLNFQYKLDELTKSTKDVFKFSDGPDDDIVMLPEQTSHLVNVGTSLIRTVGECVVKTRKVIEQVGDFDMQQPLIDEDETEPNDQAQSGAETTEEPQEEVAESRTTPTNEKRISFQMPPPPPPLRNRAMTTALVTDFPRPPSAMTSDMTTPQTPFSPASQNSLPPLLIHPATEGTDVEGHELKSPRSFRANSTSPARKCSVGTSIAGSSDTHQSSVRDSGITAVSEISTRATTPDHGNNLNTSDQGLMNSFGSISSLRSAATEASNDVEDQLLKKTYAHELTLNKDGQVTGGSLPALVEQLTTGDSAPDAQFVTAFFVTFRSFASPRDLAQALIGRFDYIGDSKSTGTPVRLRICNVFKGWLETYWNADADKDALGDIRFFAIHKLKPHLPPAGERLLELVRKVAAQYQSGTVGGPLVSGVGKTSMSIGPQYDIEGNTPEPIINKSQLSQLRNAVAGNLHSCSILDFDPLEVARQLTILASKIFCEISPDELLSLDWNKKNSTKAQNVRSMCILNTDLAHVVGDTILTPDDAKKRALVIKQWSKVATRCLELSNYESLMAIMCSLNSSVVQRLKRTWEVVSKKTRARLEELNGVVDISRNQASLRRRLENPVAPCLPFLGIYLTDLTFVDAGNPKFRDLPGAMSESGEPVSVINFDKHMRMAKIVGHVQKFQVPYKLKPLPEMQTWLHIYLERMREGHAQMVGNFHRRSLVIEPKRDHSKAPKMPDIRRPSEPDISVAEERPKTAASIKTAHSLKPHGQFDFLLKTNFNFKGRTELPPTPEATD